MKRFSWLCSFLVGTLCGGCIVCFYFLHISVLAQTDCLEATTQALRAVERHVGNLAKTENRPESSPSDDPKAINERITSDKDISGQQSSVVVVPRSSADTSSNISERDANCPFRSSPLYRKVFVYPTYGDGSGDILSEAGRNNRTHEWPWLKYERYARHYKTSYFDTHSNHVQYSTEMLVRQILTHPDSCLRTDDAEEASLFYVPYMPTLERFKGKSKGDASSRSPYGDAILDILDSENYTAWENVFGFTSKYWKRRNGADHILAFGECLHGLWHPRGRRGNYQYIHTQKQLKPPIVISVELSTTFVKTFPKCAVKNILMPYPNSDGQWFNNQLDKGTFEWIQRERSLKTTESPASLRTEKHLATLTPIESSSDIAMAPRPLAQFYSVGFHGACVAVRRSMAEDYSNCSASAKIIEHNKALKPYSMRLATFCPCPGGDSPSAKRFFDAILAGCIPIVISQDFVWPFTKEFDPSLDLDPNDFSIRLSSDDYLYPTLDGETCATLDGAKPGLQAYLESIPLDEVVRLRKGVQKARALYGYYEYSEALPDNPLLENVLPTGGAAKYLVEALAERAGGSKWKDCEQELKRPKPKVVWKFKC